LFGKDPRDEHIAWLQARIEFLEAQLTMIADSTAAARLVPRPDRKPPTGKPKTPWRHLVDKPEQDSMSAGLAAAEEARRAEQSFDARQP